MFNLNQTSFCATVLISGLLFVSVGSAHGNTLYRIDVTTDGVADRVIFELDHRADYKMSSPATDVVEIAFSDAELSPEFQLPGVPEGLKLVTRLESRIDAKGRVVITVHLQSEAEPTGITLSVSPWKYAMDLAPKMSNGDAQRPRYIPGDRPLPTKYTVSNPESAQIRLSRWLLTFWILIAFGAGIGSVFGARRLRAYVWGPPASTAVRQPTSPVKVEALQHELERDLARLKRTVEREHAEPWRALALTEERQQLILKLMREGRDLNAIAEVLDLPPDDIKKMLDHHSKS